MQRNSGRYASERWFGGLPRNYSVSLQHIHPSVNDIVELVSVANGGARYACPTGRGGPLHSYSLYE